MVRAGIKTKIFCLGASAILEYLKYTGNSTVGAEFVYGCLRPALEDALEFLPEENYHQLMGKARMVIRETARMTTATWDYLKQALSR